MNNEKSIDKSVKIEYYIYNIVLNALDISHAY